MDRLPADAIQGPACADWGPSDAATAAYHGIVTWSPTIDPKAPDTLSIQIIVEQKIRLLSHAWACAPIVEDFAMRGAIFESKEGRQAILAKVVVDTTGDADLLARAGAPPETGIDATDIHHCINTAFLVGGVDMVRWLAFRYDDKDGFTALMARGREALGFFEKPFVSWRNDVALFMGPRLSGYSALDVEDLTEVELRSRRLCVGHVDIYRAHAPGFEGAFLMLGAPQSRRGGGGARRRQASRAACRAAARHPA